MRVVLGFVWENKSNEKYYENKTIPRIEALVPIHEIHTDDATGLSQVKVLCITGSFMCGVYLIFLFKFLTEEIRCMQQNQELQNISYWPTYPFKLAISVKEWCQCHDMSVTYDGLVIKNC